MGSFPRVDGRRVINDLASMVFAAINDDDAACDVRVLKFGSSQMLSCAFSRDNRSRRYKLFSAAACSFLLFTLRFRN